MNKQPGGFNLSGCVVKEATIFVHLLIPYWRIEDIVLPQDVSSIDGLHLGINLDNVFPHLAHVSETNDRTAVSRA
jgi:hypothetical protein